MSDGSCLLVGEFGDSIKNGDKIGLILDLEETELKIYIVQNDRPLGLAFVHSAPYANELHPVVSFSSPGSVEINEKEAKELDKLLIRTDYPKKSKFIFLINKPRIFLKIRFCFFYSHRWEIQTCEND